MKASTIHSLTVLLSSPANDLRVLAFKVCLEIGQTNGNNVLFEDDLPIQPDQGDVVSKIGWTVIRMDVFAFNAKVLVRIGFGLGSDIPFTQPNSHSLFWSTVDAMTGRDDPAIRNQSSATGDSLGQEGLLDDGHDPGVGSKLGVLSPHNAVAAGVGETTLCKPQSQSRETTDSNPLIYRVQESCNIRALFT